MENQQMLRNCASSLPDLCYCCCEKAVIALIKAKIGLPTLGEETRVRFGEDNQGMYCMPRSGSRIPIIPEYIRATCERYSRLKAIGGKNSQNTPVHWAAGQYNTPNWDKYPDDRSCPYIASMIAMSDKMGLIQI